MIVVNVSYLHLRSLVMVHYLPDPDMQILHYGRIEILVEGTFGNVIIEDGEGLSLGRLISLIASYTNRPELATNKYRVNYDVERGLLELVKRCQTKRVA